MNYKLDLHFRVVASAGLFRAYYRGPDGRSDVLP